MNVTSWWAILSPPRPHFASPASEEPGRARPNLPLLQGGVGIVKFLHSQPIPSALHISPGPRPRRAEPSRQQLLSAVFVALIQKTLHGNCRNAARVCRLCFKWKLPVAGWEGLQCASRRRPCCTEGTAVCDTFGGCHAVRKVRAEMLAEASWRWLLEPRSLGGGGEWCTLPA